MKEKKPILVLFGGTGFIGSHLISYLNKNWSVYVVGRKKKFHSEAHYLYWDYKDEEKLKGILDGTEAIVNLIGANVGAGLWTSSRKAKLEKSRSFLPALLAKCLSQMEHKPRLYIQASATGYYGYNTSEAQEEKGKKGAGFLADLVEKWEAAGREVEAQGIRTIFLRTGMVLSEDGGALASLNIPFRMKFGMYFGNREAYIPWIRLEDVCRAILFLSVNKSVGIYNLTAPEAIQAKEFYTYLKQYYKSWLLMRLPGLPLRIVLGQMAKELLLANQQVEPKALLSAGFEFKYKSLSLQ